MQSDISQRERDTRRVAVLLPGSSLSLPFCHLAPSYKYIMMFNVGVKKRFVWVCITALFRTLLYWRGMTFKTIFASLQQKTMIFYSHWKFWFSCLIINAHKKLLDNKNLKNPYIHSFVVCRVDSKYLHYPLWALENISSHFPKSLQDSRLCFPLVSNSRTNLQHSYTQWHISELPYCSSHS